jgi:hypothetical protein
MLTLCLEVLLSFIHDGAVGAIHFKHDHPFISLHVDGILVMPQQCWRESGSANQWPRTVPTAALVQKSINAV